jgi:hypothetical protein
MGRKEFKLERKHKSPWFRGLQMDEFSLYHRISAGKTWAGEEGRAHWQYMLYFKVFKTQNE